MPSTSVAKPPRLRNYQRTFLREHGAGPWPCAYCGESVTALGRDTGVVHHVDEDRSNNCISNLEVMHPACHKRHHNVGKPARHGYTPDIIEKMAAARRGRPHVEAMWACDECHIRCHKCSMTRHTNASGHTARPEHPEETAHA